MDARLLVLASITALCALPALAGGGEPGPVKMAPPTQRIPVVPPPLPASTPVPTASVPRELRRAVVADAARRFNVPENQVVVASAEQLTWNDGALGCPKPGMSYLQAQVPGYRIVARAADGAFIYHTDATGNLALCDTQLRHRERGDPATPPKPVEPRAEPPPERTAPDR